MKSTTNNLEWWEGLEKLIGVFSERVDLNTYGEVKTMGQFDNHPDILWLKDKLEQFISDIHKHDMEEFEEKVIDKIDELMVYAKQNKKDYETVNEAHFAIAQLKDLLK